MTMGRTRCKQCVHANKKATEKPCNKCGEVQFSSNKNDNQFLDASKNLIREDNHGEWEHQTPRK